MSEHEWLRDGDGDFVFCKHCGTRYAVFMDVRCPGRAAPEPLREAIEACVQDDDRVYFWRSKNGWRARIENYVARLGYHMTEEHPDPESAIRAALDEFKRRRSHGAQENCGD